MGFSSAHAQTQLSDELVVLSTPSGKIIIELFPSDAPQTTSNFLNLAKQGFYDDTIFHRIIKDFMIQGGDPNTKDIKKISQWGFGGVEHTIPAEFNDIMHKRGIVSMARNNDPNSASSQFFIVHKDSIFLDKNYAAFGRLATQESYDTLDKIAELNTAGTNLPNDLSKATIQKAQVKNRDLIKNLLDQGEPQRMAKPITETTQSYSNEDFGISFDTSSLWTIQEQTKTDSRQPDIIVFGPADNKFTPRILVFVKESESESLEEFSDETKKVYAQLLDSGSLVITSEQKTTVNDNDAWIRDSIQKFESSSGTLNLQYRETVFKEDGKFYTITYANTAENFEKLFLKYTQIIDSTQIAKSDNEQKDGGCLIATAAYGTELAPQIQMLREIRDNALFSTGAGTTFMIGFNEFYYVFSPTVADLERENPIFKEFIKIILSPMFLTLSILNYVDVDSEQELIGFGLAIILINAGLYVVVPVLFAINMKNIVHMRLK